MVAPVSPLPRVVPPLPADNDSDAAWRRYWAAGGDWARLVCVVCRKPKGRCATGAPGLIPVGPDGRRVRVGAR